MSEMLFSFLVLFAVFTLGVYYYSNYKKPMGFEYKNVWVVSYNNAFKTSNTDSLDTYYETLSQNLRALPGVKEISFCSDNVPFSQNSWEGGANYNGKQVGGVNQYTVDDTYNTTMTTQLLEGRWFNKADMVAKNQPIIISSDLKEKFFGTGQAVGKLIGDGDQPGHDKKLMKVIGVIQGIKANGDYRPAGYGVYHRVDTGSYHWLGRIMVRVNEGTTAAFEARLYKILANYMKNSNVEIEHLTKKRVEANYFTVVPMIVLGIVGGFLVINVALGLFGVLWYNINKRRGEIGLRRAVGATGSSVSTQLITESMILATLSLIIGAFFAVQMPLLNVFDLAAGIYLVAMALSIIFIYLLVFLCSLYPGKQAAAIYPAVALHED